MLSQDNLARIREDHGQKINQCDLLINDVLSTLDLGELVSDPTQVIYSLRAISYALWSSSKSEKEEIVAIPDELLADLIRIIPLSLDDPIKKELLHELKLASLRMMHDLVAIRSPPVGLIRDLSWALWTAWVDDPRLGTIVLMVSRLLVVNSSLDVGVIPVMLPRVLDTAQHWHVFPGRGRLASPEQVKAVDFILALVEAQLLPYSDGLAEPIFEILGFLLEGDEGVLATSICIAVELAAQWGMLPIELEGKLLEILSRCAKVPLSEDVLERLARHGARAYAEGRAPWNSSNGQDCFRALFHNAYDGIRGCVCEEVGRTFVAPVDDWLVELLVTGLDGCWKVAHPAAQSLAALADASRLHSDVLERVRSLVEDGGADFSERFCFGQ